MDKQNQNKRGTISPLAAAVTGAVIGAGAAILKDKKNREKIQGVINKTKDQAKEQFEKIQKVAKDKKVEAEKIMDEKSEDIKRVSKGVKDTAKVIGKNFDK